MQFRVLNDMRLADEVPAPALPDDDADGGKEGAKFQVRCVSVPSILEQSCASNDQSFARLSLRPAVCIDLLPPFCGLASSAAIPSRAGIPIACNMCLCTDALSFVLFSVGLLSKLHLDDVLAALMTSLT